MITGYHTVEDRNNPEVIETSGPFKCTRSDAWLGPGYYFWDHRIDLAHFWGQMNFKKRGYVICKGMINDAHDVLWDIDGRTEHQEEFIEAWDMMLSAGFIKDHSHVIVSEVIAFFLERGLLSYQAIRAADEDKDTIFMAFKPKSASKPAQMRIRQRVQICLIEKNDVTLHGFKIVYPEDYL
jgi:hypothetical protein